MSRSVEKIDLLSPLPPPPTTAGRAMIDGALALVGALAGPWLRSAAAACSALATASAAVSSACAFACALAAAVAVAFFFSTAAAAVRRLLCAR